MLFLLFFVCAKALLKPSSQDAKHAQQALFVIKTYSPANFTLTEDDQINIITRVPTTKFSELELCLLNPASNRYYQFIPPTSEKTFLHLLRIERPLKRPLRLIDEPLLYRLRPTKRIEVFEYSKNQWVLSDANQDSFNLFQFLVEENAPLTPLLLHYLLILILFLSVIDLGIKYRILKI